jgi:DNA-binding transcriptional ArsR family regulator
MPSKPVGRGGDAGTGSTPGEADEVANRTPDEESTQDSSDSGSEPSDETVSEGVIFDILPNERRRRVLKHLDEQDGRTTLGEMAEHLAAIKNDTVFELLSDRRRRALLYALRTRAPGESIPMDALVDRLLEIDGRERPTDRRDRLVADLSHRHLPRLADAGLVDVAGDSVVRNAWEAPLSRWTDRAMRMEGSRRATDPDGSSDPEP